MVNAVSSCARGVKPTCQTHFSNPTWIYILNGQDFQPFLPYLGDMRRVVSCVCLAFYIDQPCDGPWHPFCQPKTLVNNILGRCQVGTVQPNRLVQVLRFVARFPHNLVRALANTCHEEGYFGTHLLIRHPW